MNRIWKRIKTRDYLLLVLLSLIFSPDLASASNLKINLPAPFIFEKSFGDANVYRPKKNRNKKMVIIRNWRSKYSATARTLRGIKKNLKTLNTSRARKLSLLGATDYKLKNQSIKKNKATGIFQISIMYEYKDTTGSTIQNYTKQYYWKHSRWSMTYSYKGKKATGKKYLKKLFSSFIPEKGGRSTASIEKQSTCSECTSTGASDSLMSDSVAEGRAICSTVKNPNDLKKPFSDERYDGIIGSLKYPLDNGNLSEVGGCAIGGAVLAKDIVVLTAQIVKFSYNYSIDPEYRDHTNDVVVSAIREAMDNPTQVAKIIWESMKKFAHSVQDFQCLNDRKRAELTCKLVGEFIVSPLLLYKILAYGSRAMGVNKISEIVGGVRGQYFNDTGVSRITSNISDSFRAAFPSLPKASLTQVTRRIASVARKSSSKPSELLKVLSETPSVNAEIALRALLVADGNSNEKAFYRQSQRKIDSIKKTYAKYLDLAKAQKNEILYLLAKLEDRGVSSLLIKRQLERDLNLCTGK